MFRLGEVILNLFTGDYSAYINKGINKGMPEIEQTKLDVVDKFIKPLRIAQIHYQLREAIQSYMTEVINLKFDEAPNYQRLKSYFKDKTTECQQK